LLEGLFTFLFSSSWLLSLQDLAPLIGLTVIVIILVVIAIVIVKWYRFWVKKGLEEYEREHGKT